MTPLRRRRFLRAGVAVGVGALGGCSGPDASEDGSASPGTTDADATDAVTDGTESGSGTDGDSGTAPRVPTPTESGGPRPDLDDPRVALEPIASGFAAPLDFLAPDGTDRRFVVDRDGRIWEIDADGKRDTPFVDIADRVVLGNERGLLGAAAHPEFADNGRLYLRYSAASRAGTPEGYSHTAVLAEFTVDPAARVAESPQERTLLEVPQPQGNHNAGAVAFGPGGYLYVPFGDGGGGNDVGTGHVDDWYDAVDGGNGQDLTENLLGSVLRIDVDGRGGVDSADDRPYAIPDSNPLVGREGFDEQYAWGFRNPWRLSFHGEDCYVADVGQAAWEELNLLERAGNYGWNVREGAHCFRRDSCPTTTPDGDPFVDPVAEYSHDEDGITGVSIIGGFVSESDTVPALAGAYVFADFAAQGRLFAVDPGEDPPWEIATVPVVGDAELGRFVLGFGRDSAGERYVLTTDGSSGDGATGRVARLVEP